LEKTGKAYFEGDLNEKIDVKDDSFLSKIFISYEGTFSL